MFKRKLFKWLGCIIIVLPLVTSLVLIAPHIFHSGHHAHAADSQQKLTPDIGEGYHTYTTEEADGVAGSVLPVHPYSLDAGTLAPNTNSFFSEQPKEKSELDATTRNYGGAQENWYGSKNWLNWEHLGPEYTGFRAKKTASPAKDSSNKIIPGAYDISLKMTGGTQTEYTKNKAEIVFVFDRSYSMISNEDPGNAQENRLVKAQRAFTDFVKVIRPYVTNNQLRVGLVPYSDGVKTNDIVQIGGENALKSIDDYIRSMQITAGNDAGTYTQGALRAAHKMLDASNFTENNKIIVLLSDGAASQHDSPTSLSGNSRPWGTNYPYTSDLLIKGATNNNMTYPSAANYNNNQTMTNNNPFSGYYSRIGAGNDANPYRISHSIGDGDYISGQAAIEEANQIKKDTKIRALYTIGTMVVRDGETQSARSTRLAQDLLQAIASIDPKGNVNYYYNAIATDKLLNHLNELVTELFDFVKNAHLHDSIPKTMLIDGQPSETLNGDGPIKVNRWRQADFSHLSDLPTINIGNAFNANSQYDVLTPVTGTYDASTGAIDLNHIDIPQGEMIEIIYRIHVVTERADFVPNQWLQTNGTTTFQPQQLNAILVQIGVPSVKAPGRQLVVKKTWIGDNSDNVRTRPDTLQFNLTRKNLTDGQAWVNDTLTLAKPYKDDDVPLNDEKLKEAWGKSYQQTDHDLWLPIFNNQGENITYELVEQNIPGYATSLSVTDQNQYHFTNTLTDFKYQLRKVDQSGHSLTGATFLIENQLDVDKTFENDVITSQGVIPAGTMVTAGTWISYNRILNGQTVADHSGNGIVTLDNNGTYDLPPYNAEYGQKFRISEISAPKGFELLANRYIYGVVSDGSNAPEPVTLGGDHLVDLDAYDAERKDADGHAIDNWAQRQKLFLFTDATYATLISPSSAIDGMKLSIQNDLTYFSLTNQLKRYALDITKLNSGHGSLAGARFQLFQADSSDHWQTLGSEMTTNESGQVTLDANIKVPAKYRLVETHAPDGYSRITVDLIFEIKSDGTIITTNPDAAWTLADHLTDGTVDNVIHVTAKDLRQFMMPATGDRKIIIVLGAILIVVIIVGTLMINDRDGRPTDDKTMD